MRHLILKLLVLYAVVKGIHRALTYNRRDAFGYVIAEREDAARNFRRMWTEPLDDVVARDRTYMDDGNPIKFMIPRCAIDYGGKSCGQDPCVVPEGPETKWERFSEDGISYDGFLIADVDGSRLPQHTCGGVALVSGSFVWATEEDRKLYEEGVRLQRERENACPACRADRDGEDFTCRYPLIVAKKNTTACGHGG